MAKKLPEHPWAEWARFVKDVKSRNLPEDQEAVLAEQKFVELFGKDGNGFLAAIYHAQKCKECTDEKSLMIRGDRVEVPLCDDCEKHATWVRRTQFSGDHYFCSAHAQKQKDFGKSDSSYFFWERVDTHRSGF